MRVHAASVARGDWYTLTGLYIGRAEMGLRKPKSRLVGGDFAGTVEAVGRDVTEFQPGDEVFGARSGALRGVRVRSHERHRAEAGPR